jgi:hypothetical protein
LLKLLTNFRINPALLNLARPRRQAFSFPESSRRRFPDTESDARMKLNYNTKERHTTGNKNIECNENDSRETATDMDLLTVKTITKEILLSRVLAIRLLHSFRLNPMYLPQAFWRAMQI